VIWSSLAKPIRTGKRYGDETIISRKPDMSGVEATPAQLAA